MIHTSTDYPNLETWDIVLHYKIIDLNQILLESRAQSNQYQAFYLMGKHMVVQSG